MAYFPSKKSVELLIGQPIQDHFTAKEILKQLATEYAGKGQSYEAGIFDLLSNSMSDTGFVFWEWIDQHAQLNNLLNGQFPTGHYKGRMNWEKHALFSEFQLFLSPFLLPSILGYPKLKNEDRSTLLSYCSLLAPDDRLFAEQKIFQPLLDDLKKETHSKQSVVNEQKLLEITDAFSSETIIASVQYLSRRSYHLKVQYVDLMILFLEAPACSPRLAYRILNRLSSLDLNPEHQEKISFLIKDLKSGEVTVGSSKRSAFKFRWAYVLVPLFIVAVIFTIINIKDYQKEDPQELEDQSAFEQFSPEERRQLDSLMHIKEDKFVLVEEDKDQYIWSSGSNVNLTIRQPFANEKMEQIYENWNRDAIIIEHGLSEKCKDSTTILGPYKGVKDLQSLKGDHEVYLKNESDYLVYLFCWDDYSSGDVFSIVLKPQEKMKLNLYKEQHLLFVAGKAMGKFKRPMNSGLDMPDATFDHHFCNTDANLQLSLTSTYILKRPSSGHNKILITGNNNEPFIIGDLYGILDEN
jgi:hypothetical protein